MYRILFSFLLGLTVIIMSSFPLVVNADSRERKVDARRNERISKQSIGITGRQDLGLTGRANYALRNRTLDTYRDNATRNVYGSYYGTYGYPAPSYYGTYGYPNDLYDSYYGTYDYRYPSYSSYSTYPIYSNSYVYPGYRSYYNPGMYNPNTVFVNPPSSLNYPTGYPVYSENYIYR